MKGKKLSSKVKKCGMCKKKMWMILLLAVVVVGVMVSAVVAKKKKVNIPLFAPAGRNHPSARSNLLITNTSGSSGPVKPYGGRSSDVNLSNSIIHMNGKPKLVLSSESRAFHDQSRSTRSAESFSYNRLIPEYKGDTKGVFTPVD